MVSYNIQMVKTGGDPNSGFNPKYNNKEKKSDKQNSKPLKIVHHDDIIKLIHLALIYLCLKSDLMGMNYF